MGVAPSMCPYSRCMNVMNAIKHIQSSRLLVILFLVMTNGLKLMKNAPKIMFKKQLSLNDS